MRFDSFSIEEENDGDEEIDSSIHHDRIPLHIDSPNSNSSPTKTVTLPTLIASVLLSLLASSLLTYSLISSNTSHSSHPPPSPPSNSKHDDYDPFITSSSSTGFPFTFPFSSSSSSPNDNLLGYARDPAAFNNSIVFVSEGDLFYFHFSQSSSSSSSPATRLTTGHGNELSPKISPDGKLIAFTATYTSFREAYILPLPSSGPAIRISYTDNAYGVSTIVGWSEDSSEVLISTNSLTSSLPDTRIYKITVKQSSTSPKVLGTVTPLPLAQATEGFYDQGCFYFVRYKQNSNTRYYVGGTAESLHVYCDGEEGSTIALTDDYKGTSRSPSLYVDQATNRKHLFFISDRSTNKITNLVTPSLSNVFSMELPTRVEANKPDFTPPTPVQISNQCETNYGVSEFTVDPITGNVFLRSGADIHVITAQDVSNLLASFSSSLTILPTLIPLSYRSDFLQTQESWVQVDLSKYLTSTDVKGMLKYSNKQINCLITARGQVVVSSVLPSNSNSTNSNYSPPLRKFTVSPSATQGGSIRVLSTKYINETHVILLATDLDSHSNAEHAFFVARGDGKSSSALSRLGTFVPGSSKDGGLGSVRYESFTVSRNGKYAAWHDTDGRLGIITISSGISSGIVRYVPTWIRVFGGLVFSRNGRYLAFEHNARNQFTQISIVDLEDENLTVVHATVDRFNCRSPVFGSDDGNSSTLTALYFLSDRDIRTDTSSPWGTRAPSPHFVKSWSLHSLPLTTAKIGAFDSTVGELEMEMDDSTLLLVSSDTPHIDFGPNPNETLEFARRANLIPLVPPADYSSIVSQTQETGKDQNGLILRLSNGDLFALKGNSFFTKVLSGVSFCNPSTDNEHLYCTINSKLVLLRNYLDLIAMPLSIDTADLTLSVNPVLEYQVMYGDSWRMLRDYFYDDEMHGLNWTDIHDKYKPLVSRATHREELDDVFKHLGAELASLHVFVYGGDYRSVFDNEVIISANEVAGLGAELILTPEGMRIVEIFEADPDFPMLENVVVSSPLSDRTMRRSNQVGLLPGDVITSVNNVNVLTFPSINYALRGQANKAVKLGVIRKNRDGTNESESESESDIIITTTVSGKSNDNLRYSAWEYRTRTSAIALAAAQGRNVGYIHLRDMSGGKSEDSFARGYFSSYNADGLVIDVRNNRGGNIDAWLLELLQRKPWMYWQGRSSNITNGGLGWDEQFAFNGKIVVLINEHTASDGEAFARGAKTLGIATLVGRRTWGGGIWLSSDNTIVDGGLGPSSPEVATYNNEFGLGLGIENLGVEPDFYSDNDPHEAFLGKDSQLVKGVEVLLELINVGMEEGGTLKTAGRKKSVLVDPIMC